MQTTASDILASQTQLARHPASSQLGSDIYSSAANSVSEIVERQRLTASYTSQSNTLNFSSQSTFFIQPGSVIGAMMIAGDIVLPRYARANPLWGLDAIDTIELVVSGSSSIQSQKISGQSHRDYILASYSSNKMLALIEANNQVLLTSAGATVKFAFPIHMFFSSLEGKASFPLDTSTLSSQLLVNIRWKPVWKVFSGDATNAVTLPVGFNSLALKVLQQVGLGNNFALSNQMKSDPSLVYSIPSNYLQSFTAIENVANLSVTNSLTLTSMPSGHLQGILISCQEQAYVGTVGTQTLINPWNSFDYLRILYNGQEIYNCSSAQEIALSNASLTDHDVGAASRITLFTTALAAVSVGSYMTNSVAIIPFANDLSDVLRGRRHEHTKSYSGSSLIVEYRIKPQEQYGRDGPFAFRNSGTGSYALNFTFINAALYEISQRTVSMEM